MASQTAYIQYEITRPVICMPAAIVLAVISGAAFSAQTSVPYPQETLVVYADRESSSIESSSNEYVQTKQIWSSDVAPNFAEESFQALSVYTPNVQPDRLGAGTGEDYRIRGFNSAGRLMLDGVLDNQSYYIRDSATYESVEVIKGQNSVLYGAGSPGGTINFIGKKPSFTPHSELTLAAGNSDYRRMILDSTGPFSGQFAYRAVVAASHRESWKQNVSQSPLTLLTGLSWQNEHHLLTAIWEFSDHDYPYDFDNVYANGAPVYDVSYVHPATNAQHRYQRWELQASSELSGDWQLDAIVRSIHGTRKERQVGFYYLVSDDKPLVGFYQKVDETFSQLTGQISLTTQKKWFGYNQEWVLGISHHQTESKGSNQRAIGQFSLDIYQPDFNFPLPTQTTNRETQLDWQESAISIQQRIELSNDLFWVLGGRWSDYQLTTQRNGITLGASENKHLSYATGFEWALSTQHAARLSYTQSWLPNSGQDRQGSFYQPSRGEQWELGWKWQAQHNWLDIALFDITQSHLLVRDPTDPSYYLLAGEKQAKGAEITALVAFAPKWELYLMSSWLDNQITNSDRYQGKEMPGIPERQHAALLTYLPNDQWRFLLGVNHQPKRYGDASNSFKVDGFTRWDLQIEWQIFANTQLRFTMQNLTDEKYVSYIAGQDFVRFGEPRQCRLIGQYQW
ncbi:hypothetical protein BOO25_17090 [Vibrio navarrensis]|uniref:TonB-dependent siderophore receptor n=1 Tax=Vibrio navarrensis TaxID=29495 RepID=UPI00192F6E26|nr:TonB-dependent receptor [Vibrio navarrensis]MBE3670643.1 hypothetical protein [Vibrio navarrensis]